jgi:hypothetical protein
MKEKEKWMPHIIAVTALAVFIVLGLACASTPDDGIRMFNTANGMTNGFWFEIIGIGTGIRIKSYNGKEGDLVIPEKIKGLPVVEIGREAFRNCRITSVTIPSSVTSIGNEAFANNQLTSVTIPSSVSSVKSRAFDDLTGTFVINGSRPGNYTKQGDVWLHNGMAMQQPAIIQPGRNVWLVSIDGNSIGSYYREGVERWTRSDISKIGGYSLPNLPSRITEFYAAGRSGTGKVYLSAGTHTVEVIYLSISTGIYSSDSMLWEQRYLFEGYTYVVTAVPTSDNKIQFGIRRQ